MCEKIHKIYGYILLKHSLPSIYLTKEIFLYYMTKFIWNLWCASTILKNVTGIRGEPNATPGPGSKAFMFWNVTLALDLTSENEPHLTVNMDKIKL